MTAQLSFRKIASVAGLITALLIIFTFMAVENAIAASPIPENKPNTVDHFLQGSRAEAFDCSTVTEIPQQECEALVSLYNDTNGDNWTQNDGWLTTNTPCNWHGVTCGGGSVNEIKLGDNRLTGTLPPQLGDLAGLTLLHLYKNQLMGSLPPEWGNLSLLTNLHLDQNKLTGSLPAAWGSMTSLKILQLFTNQLNGELPPELGDMSSLETLGLYDNQFTGPIPAELGQLHALTGALLYGNNLSGPIPPELGNLTELEQLNLANNNLTDSIPPELGNLLNLTTLDLAHNKLSGNIPVELSKLLVLRNLYLNNNFLTGPIPDLTPLRFSLWRLYLDSNRLTGNIPPELGSLTELRELNLGHNHLNGPIPPELGMITELRELYLNNNLLTGSIPTELCNLKNLIWLDLQNNRLDGPIPPCLGDLVNMERLNLFNNRLDGNIPPQLGNLINLISLNLFENQLSGPIPSELGNLENLTNLSLYDNQLSGPIPPELGNLQKLEAMHLNDNLLEGPLLKELGNLKNLKVLKLDNNLITGGVPATLGDMGVLNTLQLDHNPLSGGIPATLGKLSNLRYLQLNSTGLSGPLPYELTNLQLTRFWFDDSYICVPDDTTILDWLTTIPDLKSVGVTCPSIYVQKSSSRLTAIAGDTIRYSISITSTVSASIHFTESWPVEATYVSLTAPGGATYDETTHEIHFHDPDLKPDEAIKIEYEVQVNDDVESGALLTAMTTVSDDQGYTLQSPTIVVVPHLIPVKTLVLIYAIGDNNLASHMIRLINRVEQGLANGTPDRVKVELLFDGPGEKDTYIYSLQPDTNSACPNLLNPSCDGRYVEGRNFEHLLNDNMTTPEGLSQFMTQAISKYPNAEQIIISLVGHGSGWEPNVIPPQPSQWNDKAGGLLLDTHPYTTTLSTRELGDAFRWTHTATDRKIDLLYLDACSMAMIEVGYELHSNVDLLLASESLSWTAFPYDNHIAAIDNSKDGRAIGLAWLQNEAEYLASESDLPFTLSLTDLTQLDTLRTAIDKLNVELEKTLPDSKNRLGQVHANTDCFESNYDGVIDEKDNYCDIKSLAEQVQIEFSASPTVTIAAQAVLSQIETVVISETHQGGTPWEQEDAEPWEWGDLGGLSIYAPFNAEADDWKRQHYTFNHLLFAQDSKWDELVASFWAGVEPPSERTCSPDCIAQPLPFPEQPAQIPYRVLLPAAFR